MTFLKKAPLTAENAESAEKIQENSACSACCGSI